MKKLIFALLYLFTASVYANQTIKIQFVVDQSLVTGSETESNINSTLDQWVSNLNFFFENSGVHMTAQVATVIYRNISANGSLTDSTQLLHNMYDQSNGFEDIFHSADRYGADFTYAVVGKVTKPGVANEQGEALKNTSIQAISSTQDAIAVSELSAGSSIFAHELGHNMGLSHGKLVSDFNSDPDALVAIAPYAMGYGQISCSNCSPNRLFTFGTIMTQNYISEMPAGAIGTPPVDVPYFSNPNVQYTYCNGACGDASIGDAARALNEYASYYARHESTDVDLLPYSDPNLQNCIASYYTGYEINQVQTLSCYSRNISSLDGIEALTSLTDIDLSGNNITNVSPLTKLSNSTVASINLTGNNHVVCGQLSALDSEFPGKVIRPPQCFSLSTIVASTLLN